MFVVIIATAFSFLFTACVDDVPIDRVFNETQKLVLYSRLCPQMDTTYILLTNTKLLYSSNDQEMMILKDGVVELSADGNHWVKATYFPEKEHFILTKKEFPIQEGATYYIRASYPGYENVSASCTVPYTHDVSFRFDTVSANGDVHLGEVYNWPHKDIYAEWRDVSGEENYYALVLYNNMLEYNYDENGLSVITHSWQYLVQWMYLNNADYRYVSDEGRDGELMRYMVNDGLPEEEYEGEEEEDGEQFYYLFFLDRNCYLYEKTYNESEFDLGFLQLEPTHAYTNIENGFGLFGAFSMRQVP